ncbi:MAG: ABC transporter permease [Mycetocola sp.]
MSSRLLERTPGRAAIDGRAGIPIWLLLPAVAGVLLLTLPLAALAWRADWANVVPLVTSDSALASLRLSLVTAGLSTLICVAAGIPLAVVLARSTGRGMRLVRALVLIPLVLPPVVSGLALLYAFGRRGPIGELLASLGIQVAFSTAAVVLAQVFVSLPFFVLTLEGALRTHGIRFDRVAATLGASPTVILARVTVPLVLPGLVTATVLAFARALGEFGATLTFAGNLSGVTRTLPLEIYLQRESDAPAAVALSLVLVAAALCLALTAYRPAARP